MLGCHVSKKYLRSYKNIPKNKHQRVLGTSITRIVKEKVGRKLFALVACQVRLWLWWGGHGRWYQYEDLELTKTAPAIRCNMLQQICWFNWNTKKKQNWHKLTNFGWSPTSWPILTSWNFWSVTGAWPSHLCGHFLGEAKRCQSFHLRRLRLENCVGASENVWEYREYMVIHGNTHFIRETIDGKRKLTMKLTGYPISDPRK